MPDAKFWRDRWAEGRIGFHLDDVHPDLIQYGDAWLGDEPHRVFVPMCGKTRDLSWLTARGHDVVAVEIVEQGVRELHEEQGIDAEESREGPFLVFRSAKLTVYCGDFFDLRPAQVAADRVWDRAALIAVDGARRPEYVHHLRSLVQPMWTMLLNALEYDPSVMDGPPFAVTDDEVRGYYGDLAIETLHRRDDIAREPRWQERGHHYWMNTTYLIRS